MQSLHLSETEPRFWGLAPIGQMLNNCTSHQQFVHSSLAYMQGWHIGWFLADIRYLASSDIRHFQLLSINRYPIYPSLQFVTDTISDILKKADNISYLIIICRAKRVKEKMGLHLRSETTIRHLVWLSFTNYCAPCSQITLPNLPAPFLISLFLPT